MDTNTAASASATTKPEGQNRTQRTRPALDELAMLAEFESEAGEASAAEAGGDSNESKTDLLQAEDGTVVVSAGGAGARPSGEASEEAEAGGEGAAAGEGEGDGAAAAAEEAPVVEGVEAEDLPANAPEWYVKRLGKYTKAAKAAQEEVAALKEQLKGAGAAAGAGDDDFLRTPEVVAAEKGAEQARRNVTAAQGYLDRMDDEAETVVAELIERKMLGAGATVREARAYLRTQERAWNEKLAEGQGAVQAARGAVQQRREQERQAYTALARAEFPWLSDPKSAQHGEAQAILKRTPWLAKDPAKEMWLGVAVEMAAKIRAKYAKSKTAAAAAPAAPAGKQPPKLPGATATAAPVKKTADTTTVLKNAVKTGKSEDIAEALADF